tara:strand:+ start:8364 stop:11078 length:2715 start_codon:yes stop_codon:yes gene_type:complete
MKKNYLTLLICFFCLLNAFAQGETSNWYFGLGAGIHFNNDGSVTPLTNGKLNTVEGCTSISDASGNLLAYTDGITVYNKNHQIVQNGTGLYGDPSSTQSAIVVPKPQDPNIYYIFTVDTSVNETDPDFGLNYSVLDISMNNGNGAIIQKNSNLLHDSSEKIAGVIKDCFEQSIWVITLASPDGSLGFYNTYHCFEVSAAGVNSNSVKSTFNDLAIGDPRGYLKLSSDGSKMVSTNVIDGAFLYDFDANTGVISNQKRITIPGTNTLSYGAEFSNETKYLYINTFNDEDISRSSLIQYDIQAADISASATIIDEREAYRGALQMAENGKIYRTNPKSYDQGIAYLSVINKPSEKGSSANYQHNVISLNGKLAMQGLPPFIQSFFNKTDLIKNPDGSTSSSLTVCEGDGFILEADDFPGATYNWEKDGVPISNSNSYFLEITKSGLADAGKYRLEITPIDPKECPIIGESLIKINPAPFSEALTIVQCDIDEEDSTDGVTTINLEQAYLFEDNAKDLTFLFYETVTALANEQPISNPIGYINTIPKTQILYYKSINNSGCSSSGELQLVIEPTTVSLNSKSPFYTCDINPDDLKIEGIFDLEQIRKANYQGLEATFYTSLIDASIEQNSISGSFLTPSTTIYVRLENSNECQGVDELELIVNPTPSFTFLDTYYICTDGISLNLNAPNGYDIYKWIKLEGSNEIEISNTSITSISEPGNYALELGYDYSINGETIICTNNSNFIVKPSNKAVIQNIEIKDISDNNTVEVFVSGDGSYEYSLDGINYQDDPMFSNVPAGYTTVYINDTYGCGITQEKITIIGYPKFFTPNGDGANDIWQIIGVDDMIQPNSTISIFDRYGKLIETMTPKIAGWDGNINGTPLPAADYWFKVNLDDGRIFKGHFALKR